MVGLSGVSLLSDNWSKVESAVEWCCRGRRWTHKGRRINGSELEGKEASQCVGQMCTSVYLLNLVYDEVALVAQHSGRVSVLLGQQVEPLGESVHHGQHDGPQEAQDIKDPLDGFSMACDERTDTHTTTSMHQGGLIAFCQE